MTTKLKEGVEKTVETESLLEQAIMATKQTERDRASELLKTLTESALKGTVTWDKSVTSSINKAISQIDQCLSNQLAKVMHAESFKKLEGAWRGLSHFVYKTETSVNLKIRMLHISKRDLYRDLDKAIEFDQSQLYRKIYESEFGTPGGQPYGLLIGDYEFSNHPDDINMLRQISEVSAAAFCPFVTSLASIKDPILSRASIFK